MDKALQNYTYNTYSLGLESLKESYQIEIQDLQATLVKQFAKRQISNRILVQPFIHAQMDKLNKSIYGLKITLKSLSMDNKITGVYYFLLQNSHITHGSMNIPNTLHIN